MRFSPSVVILALAAAALATPSPCPQFCVECKDGTFACACEARKCLAERTLEARTFACPQYCIECDDGKTLCACAAVKGCPVSS
ncbi:hypothetical protein AURDEDRAFT_167190 [Auricularia subglabra TFB-10046 SS5]|nr:hypothetical protein AURDEDRAFT_167190 [Auricularia subglabra TFB-10046 SS5]